MGTRFEFALVADRDDHSTARLRAVGEQALEAIGDWHRRLTRFEPDSWLCHLNRTAAREPVRLDEATFALFHDAQEVWRASGGAFDITRGHGNALVLDDTDLTLRFLHDDVSVDLGGIGKGHALDCAAECLRGYGVTRALLQGGTSSGTGLGRPPGAGGWRVGLAPDPERETVDLVDASFAVSDNGSQPDAPLGRHIVDPRAAMSDAAADAPGLKTRPPMALPTERRRVVVTGPSARVADAWSTALVVLGAVPPGFPGAYHARFLRSEP